MDLTEPWSPTHPGARRRSPRTHRLGAAAARTRRGARPRHGRRRHDELPRLPGAHGRAAGGRLAVRPVRPVDRPAVHPLRGDVRAHRRRGCDAAHPLVDRRPAAHRRHALAARAHAACCSTRSGCCSTSSGPARSCRTTARCSRVAAHALHAAQPVDRRRRRRRRARRLADPLVGLRARARRARHELAHVPGRPHTARPGVRRVRERHPPAVPVARVPLRRHRARSRARTGRGGGRPSPEPASPCSPPARSPMRRRPPTGARAAQQRPVRPRPRIHGQCARHRAACVRRDLVARRPVRHHARWSTRSGVPARCRSRSTSRTRWCSTCSRPTTGSTSSSRAASPPRSRFAAVFWLTATGAAVAYHHRFGRGPAERLYRALTA